MTAQYLLTVNILQKTRGNVSRRTPCNDRAEVEWGGGGGTGERGGMVEIKIILPYKNYQLR